MCGVTTTVPKYKHVVFILEENTSYSGIIGSSQAPYINSVAKACGLATNYHNITHPSLPEYIAMTSGLPLSQLTPFLPDCTPSATCESASTNLFNQLPSKWKAYDESMPSNCDKANSGNYAPRHNPAVYYTDLNSTCKTRDVPLGSTSNSNLLKDFSSETTAPAFAFVTPNLCHDMHGDGSCSSGLVKSGDSWLSTWLPLITATTVYKANDTLIVIVWDEGAGGSGGENCATNTTDQSCHVPAILVAPSVKAGTVSSTLFNHYSLLKTTEDILGVPELGRATKATSMAAAFNI
jgi:hypothetical protein